MTRVSCYRNLRTGAWSALGPHGRVAFSAPNVTLLDVDFVVRPAGRARVLRERRKNVHAYARGTVVDAARIRSARRLQWLAEAAVSSVTYDPYFSDWDSSLLAEVRALGWFRVVGERWPVVKAELCLLTPFGVHAAGLSFWGDDDLPF